MLSFVCARHVHGDADLDHPLLHPGKRIPCSGQKMTASMCVPAVAGVEVTATGFVTDEWP